METSSDETEVIRYDDAKQAIASLQATAEDARDRWKWVRRLVYLIVALMIASVAFGLWGLLTTRDTRDAVQTANFSEEQRAARSNRADCIREYETDYRLADAHFNAAIVNYLAFSEGDITGAAALLDELNKASTNLEAIQTDELCTKKEFGVVDTPTHKKTGDE